LSCLVVFGWRLVVFGYVWSLRLDVGADTSCQNTNKHKCRPYVHFRV
jgi:hypothetical protein